MTIPTDMPPEYFETHFRVPASLPQWPREFVIVSAYATTGESWPAELNVAADQTLEAELRVLGCWLARVTGFSPRTGHAEPSWAAEISLAEGCDLGLRYRQDAIYHVAGDLLSVTKCAGDRQLSPVGGFRERLCK